MADKDGSAQAGSGGEGAAKGGATDSLRPEPGLEMVRHREFLSENVSISGRHFERCSFNFCNLIYSGGPVGLVECGGTNNRLVEVGPMLEALKDMDALGIRDKMIRYWKDVRVGLHLEIPEGY